MMEFNLFNKYRLPLDIFVIAIDSILSQYTNVTFFIKNLFSSLHLTMRR